MELLFRLMRIRKRNVESLATSHNGRIQRLFFLLLCHLEALHALLLQEFWREHCAKSLLSGSDLLLNTHLGIGSFRGLFVDFCGGNGGRLLNGIEVLLCAIGRDEKDRQKMAVRADGKPAVTHFRVMERIGDYTITECRLETGRTHQIRVHLAHIGYPVFGDPKYGSRKKTPFDGIIEGQALHSRQMTLVHPVTGEEMTFTAPMPKDMEKLIAAIRARAEQK